MRFVVTGEWRENHLLRLILAGFLVYVVLLWITNLLLFFSHMSLTYASVVEFYLGSEERFASPRSFTVLLEISHFHLFAMVILIITMTHLVLFAPISTTAKATIIVLSFASGLADEAAGWLVRFVHPGFAYVKMAAFVLLQATLAATVGIVAWAVWKAPRTATQAF
jgi:hypothetical protein